MDRILYADDDTDLRKVVAAELRSLGYTVSEAEDGEKALALLDRQVFDLVLLDINMPVRSGIDVLRHLQQKKMPCRTIMLTARVGFKVATESLQLGADEYITKPFSLDYLTAAVQRLLKGGPSL